MGTLLTADIVLTSAIQVAIAIAGFTGIIIAISKGAQISARERISVSILLLASIATVTFAFLPMIFLNAGVSERSTWMTSSILFVIYFVSIVSYRVTQFRQSGVTMPAAVASGIGILGIVALLQLANAIFIRDSWPYLILIVSYVIYSFIVFAYLLWSLWTE
ncbi:MAG: hypothetical protein AABZ67_01340 [Pseudomonadota bacterium]